jgi:GNAT superfamily N-acetyltransferase
MELIDLSKYEQPSKRPELGVTIRLVTAGDWVEWDRLWTAYLTFYEAVLPEAQHKLTFERYLTRPDMKAFVAVRNDGAVVGLANTLFQMSGWRASPQVYLQDLFVDPNSRSKGVGKALIEHVKTRAQDAGASKLIWNTRENNYRARAVYDTVADGGKPSGFIQYSITWK